MAQKKIIAYAISNDYEKVRNIEKSIWENKRNASFDSSNIAIAPNPKPGYKGLFYLNVTDPSDELIKGMKPSYIPVSADRYPQFDDLTDNDIKDIITMMVYKQNRDPKEIAKTLGVTVADVMVWSYYAR